MKSVYQANDGRVYDERQIKIAFQASDGQVFETQRLCELHESKHAHRGTILAYLRKDPELALGPSIAEVLDSILKRYDITLK